MNEVDYGRVSSSFLSSAVRFGGNVRDRQLHRVDVCLAVLQRRYFVSWPSFRARKSATFGPTGAQEQHLSNF